MSWFRRTPEERDEKAREAASLTCARAMKQIDQQWRRTGVVPGKPITFAFHTIDAGPGFVWVRPGTGGVTEYLTLLTDEVLAYDIRHPQHGGTTGRVKWLPLGSIALVADTPFAEHQFAVVFHDRYASMRDHPDAPVVVHRFSATREPGLSQLLLMELALLLKQGGGRLFGCPARIVSLDDEGIERHRPNLTRWVVDMACEGNPRLAEDVEWRRLWRRKHAGDGPPLSRAEERRLEGLTWRQQQYELETQKTGVQPPGERIPEVRLGRL